MNQGEKRSFNKLIKVVNFISTAASTSVISHGSLSSGGSSHYGETLDLQTYTGFESVLVCAGAKAIISNDTDEVTLSGHFLCDSSSAFGGSTTIGSTFSLTIYPSSATSTEAGGFCAAVNLNDAALERYLRFILVVNPSTADNDNVVFTPVYILAGKDNLPTTANTAELTSAISS